MKYFSKLPVVTYNSVPAVDITARATVSVKTKQNRNSYYPYTVKEGDRPDIIADKYYDDPDYAWLVFYSNDVVDPYYDLGSNQQSFDALIIKKYGSIAAARRKIRHYRNDWEGDETSYTPAQYSALDAALKPYYDPIRDGREVIVSYERKRVGWEAATNKTVSLSISSLVGSFTVGEEVQANSTNYAFVTQANSSVITVQHVQGALSAADSITGQTSGATATIDTANVLNYSISNTVSSLWSPVTYYDYEREKQAINKEINLIDNGVASEITRELKRAFGK